jgi:hypothetical protein
MKLNLVIAAAAALLGACQTAPARDAGLLSAYEGLAAQEGSLRASVRQRRDDAAAGGIDRIWIEPAVLAPGAAESVSDDELALVLGEVDRQLCYELSERFTVVPERQAGVARVRSGVAAVKPTGQAGSALSAAASFFIPGPIGVRAPGTTGGLAAEAELLSPDGAQVAAIAWARNATVVGTDSPSLSRVGDALQLAEPFGDAVGDAFAPPGRAVRPVPQPDPCARFGPRNRPEGFLARLATGLYVPQLSGARSTREPPRGER